jgi:hypothetical protein
MPAGTTVNGNAYSFVQIETHIGQLPIAGIKDISYKDNLIRTEGHGTAPTPLYITAGTYHADGRIEFYKKAFNYLFPSYFGANWRQTQTYITVSYGPDDSGIVISDVLPLVLFGEVIADNMQSDDGGALTNKVNLYIPNQILWNGVASIVASTPLVAVGTMSAP